MNNYHLAGMIMVVAVLVLGWFLYRQYKKVGRRCEGKKCGSTRVKRVSKIVLAPDEAVCFRSSSGEWRWWIRRVVKLTFTVCRLKENHDGHEWVKVVKIDYDPISVWHAYWVKWFHKEQYYLTERALIEAVQRNERQRRLGKHDQLDPQASDTPPLSLDSLFLDYFEELAEFIDGDGKI